MQRFASALAIAVGAVLLCLAAPPALRHAVIGLAALLGCREAVRITAHAFESGEAREPGRRRSRILAGALVLVLASLGLDPPLAGFSRAAAAAFGFALVGLVTLTLPRTPAGLGRLGALCLAGAWIGVPTAALLELSAGADGGRTLLLLLAAVWIGEAAAFGGGRLIGGPRLAPSLSPKKTWAGFGSQLLVSAGVTVLAGALLDPWPDAPPGLAGGAALGVFLGAAAALGDLFASYWKRASGRKDAGRLIPGHGGVLDRVDGVLFAALALLAAETALIA